MAVVEKTGTNYDVRYVMTDYLGSICAVTDDAGTVLQQISLMHGAGAETHKHGHCMV